jgi:thiamine biosynthesis lipoprotein
MKQAYFKSISAMTSHLDITIIEEPGKDEEVEMLMQKGFEEADRLINIISAWQEGTELFEVNKHAGVRPVTFFTIKKKYKNLGVNLWSF